MLAFSFLIGPVPAGETGRSLLLLSVPLLTRFLNPNFHRSAAALQDGGRSMAEGLPLLWHIIIPPISYFVTEYRSGTTIQIDGGYPIDLYPTMEEILKAAQHNEYEENDPIYKASLCWKSIDIDWGTPFFGWNICCCLRSGSYTGCMERLIWPSLVLGACTVRQDSKGSHRCANRAR